MGGRSAIIGYMGLFQRKQPIARKPARRELTKEDQLLAEDIVSSSKGEGE